jgi:hypothetical protein
VSLFDARIRATHFVERAKSQHSGQSEKAGLALIWVLLLQLYVPKAIALIPPYFRSTGLPNSFQWSSITPTEGIVYHDCYPYKIQSGEAGIRRPNVRLAESESHGGQNCSRNYQCARLLLPLDWQNPSNTNKVAIAIIKIPAKILVQDQSGTASAEKSPTANVSYGGAVIVNPGGPGEFRLRFQLIYC